jgi:CrcB protein
LLYRGSLTPGEDWSVPPRIGLRGCAAVFVGGGCGTLARAGMETALPHSATAWPWATFTVNVVACLVLGYVVTRLAPSSPHRPLLATGLCGGLSTFSTMQVELLSMLDGHAYGIAAGYAAGSIAAGYVGILLGSTQRART